MAQGTMYYKRVQVSIDHTTGTVRSRTVVLGGAAQVAESSPSKDSVGRLAELFKHQQTQQLSPESERFLRRGAE